MKLCVSGDRCVSTSVKTRTGLIEPACHSVAGNGERDGCESGKKLWDGSTGEGKASESWS